MSSVALLLHRGADTALRNRRGETAADVARRVGRDALADADCVGIGVNDVGHHRRAFVQGHAAFPTLHLRTHHARLQRICAQACQGVEHVHILGAATGQTQLVGMKRLQHQHATGTKRAQQGPHHSGAL